MLQINSKKKKNFTYILLIIIIICFCLLKIFTKSLDKKVIEVLKKDQLTLDNYKARYRYLSCKLIIYSKLKYMFEYEKIDTFANVTDNKKDFIDIYYDEMLKKCNQQNVDTDVKIFLFIYLKMLYFILLSFIFNFP